MKYGVRIAGTTNYNDHYYSIDKWIKTCSEKDGRFGTNNLNEAFEYFAYLIWAGYSRCEVFVK